MTRQARSGIFLTVSGVAVAAALAAGFFRLGPPARQRDFQADTRRIENLRQIAQNLQASQAAVRRQPMPISLEELRLHAPYLQIHDPVTGRLYEYRILAEPAYELCAVFMADSEDSLDRPAPGTERAFWSHAKGHYCFRLDASRFTPF